MGVTQAKPYAKSELSAIVLTGYISFLTWL